MKATVPYIEAKFDEFNRQIFGGKLPKPPIELSNAKTYLGVCVSQKCRLPGGQIERYNFRLRFSTRIDLPEQELEDTIIHEMIHYYIGINKLKDNSAHGPVFKHIMNSINTVFGRHISISHKSTKEQREQAYDTKRRWHVVAVVSLADGKTGVKVLPRILPRILNYYNKVGASGKVTAVKLFMSDDIFFNRYPNSSALNVIIADRDEVMSHLQDAVVIECDGKRIVMME